MREYTISENGKTYRRISKVKARKAFEEDRVCICPCNLRPFGFWPAGVWITDCGRSFDSLVNEFEALNCINSETGKYAAFYVEI